MAQNKWRSNSSVQGNSLHRIGTYDEFMAVWPHMLEGYEDLIAKSGANMSDLTIEEMFKTILELSVYPERGFVGVLENKRGLPLGYLVAANTTLAFRPKELTLFVIWSNQKCPSTTRELMYELKGWATSQGFKSIKGRMYKRSGAGMRFISHVLGMRLTGMLYEVVL